MPADKFQLDEDGISEMYKAALAASLDPQFPDGAPQEAMDIMLLAQDLRLAHDRIAELERRAVFYRNNLLALKGFDLPGAAKIVLDFALEGGPTGE